jgi:hypothetical protein
MIPSCSICKSRSLCCVLQFGPAATSASSHSAHTEAGGSFAEGESAKRSWLRWSAMGALPVPFNRDVVLTSRLFNSLCSGGSCFETSMQVNLQAWDFSGSIFTHSQDSACDSVATSTGPLSLCLQVLELPLSVPEHMLL